MFNGRYCHKKLVVYLNVINAFKINPLNTFVDYVVKNKTTKVKIVLNKFNNEFNNMFNNEFNNKLNNKNFKVLLVVLFFLKRMGNKQF